MPNPTNVNADDVSFDDYVAKQSEDQDAVNDEDAGKETPDDRSESETEDVSESSSNEDESVNDDSKEAEATKGDSEESESSETDSGQEKEETVSETKFYSEEELKDLDLESLDFSRVPEGVKHHYESLKRLHDNAKGMVSGAQRKFAEAAEMRKAVETEVARNLEKWKAENAEKKKTLEKWEAEDQEDPEGAPMRAKIREMEAELNKLKGQNQKRQQTEEDLARRSDHEFIVDTLKTEAKKGGIPDEFFPEFMAQAFQQWTDEEITQRNNGIADEDLKLTPISQVVSEAAKRYTKYNTPEYALEVLKKHPEFFKKIEKGAVEKFIEEQKTNTTKNLPPNSSDAKEVEKIPDDISWSEYIGHYGSEG